MRLTRIVPLVLTLALAGADVGAQAANDPDVAAKKTGAAPAGWEMRFDRPDADASGINFTAAGNGLRVTTGPAAVLWNAKNVSSGPFALEATFTQVRKPTHPEAYGLVWGGENLKADNQSYYYLIVRGDGKYMVKHRAGAETHELVPWTDHAAIVKEGADGKATNTLRVEATASGVKLLANGQLLRQLAADATEDGIAGVRVNHNLDVAIDGFAVKKP
jgi:hypothetical protein